MEEETVTVPKKTHEKLLRDSKWLACLNAAGVDNWEGSSVAYDYQWKNNPKCKNADDGCTEKAFEDGVYCEECGEDIGCSIS